MFRYYLVVPPKWGFVSSVLFTIVPMLYKIKNTWFILLSHISHPILDGLGLGIGVS